MVRNLRGDSGVCESNGGDNKEVELETVVSAMMAFRIRYSLERSFYIIKAME